MEMIDLLGHQIDFCTVVPISAAKPEEAVAQRVRLDCRRVLGYVMPERTFAIALAAGAAQVGNFVCYLLPSESPRLNPKERQQTLARTDITADKVMTYEGRTYQIEYTRPLMSRGLPVLHQLRLVQTDLQASIAQPGGASEFTRLIEDSDPTNTADLPPLPIPGTPSPTPPSPDFEFQM